MGIAVKACCFLTRITRPVVDRRRRLLSQMWATSTMEIRRRTCSLSSTKLSTMQQLTARTPHCLHQTSLPTKRCQLRCSWFSAENKRTLQALHQKPWLSETNSNCSQSPIKSRNSQQQKRRDTDAHLDRFCQVVSSSPEEETAWLFLLGKTCALRLVGWTWSWVPDLCQEIYLKAASDEAWLALQLKMTQRKNWSNSRRSWLTTSTGSSARPTWRASRTPSSTSSAKLPRAALLKNASCNSRLTRAKQKLQELLKKVILTGKKTRARSNRNSVSTFTRIRCFLLRIMKRILVKIRKKMDKAVASGPSTSKSQLQTSWQGCRMMKTMTKLRAELYARS